VSKDINMRVKARALGLPAEDYTNDRCWRTRTSSTPASSSCLQLLGQERQGDGVVAVRRYTYYRITGPIVTDLLVNQFVYLENGTNFYAQVREIRGKSAVLRVLRDYTHAKNAVWGVTARNREQSFALNLLMDPECDFVTLIGQAGTGKTLLALAAGLSQTLETKRFAEIIVTAPPFRSGGHRIPAGHRGRKDAPWMGALEDNLEVLNKTDDAAGEWAAPRPTT